jgi:hypothetical protein
VTSPLGQNADHDRQKVVRILRLKTEAWLLSRSNAGRITDW